MVSHKTSLNGARLERTPARCSSSLISQRKGLGELEAFTPALTLTRRVIPDQSTCILTSRTYAEGERYLKGR